MISIAMQLGLAPLPATPVSGRVHRADGSAPENKHETCGDRRAEKVRQRHGDILDTLTINGPTLFKDLCRAMKVSHDTMKSDMRALLDEGRVGRRLEGRAHIYWVMP